MTAEPDPVDYKYDLAISFLSEDEPLAIEIADRIGDRLSIDVFVYSKRQDELLGRDGVEAFSGVFGRQSRTVAILHRERWGKTPWTRIEATAIRERTLDEGHDFIVLLRLDRSDRPVWIPRTQLYLGFEKYGIDGAASVLEGVVQRAGGTVRSESVLDYAGRIDRRLGFERSRNDWFNSIKGVEDAKAEAIKFCNQFTSLGIQIQTDQCQTTIRPQDLYRTSRLVNITPPRLNPSIANTTRSSNKVLIRSGVLFLLACRSQILSKRSVARNPSVTVTVCRICMEASETTCL